MPLTVLNIEIENILKSHFEFSGDSSQSEKLSYHLQERSSLNTRLVKMQNMCRNKKIDTKNHPIAWSNVLRSAANSQFHALWNSKTIWYVGICIKIATTKIPSSLLVIKQKLLYQIKIITNYGKTKFGFDLNIFEHNV